MLTRQELLQNPDLYRDKARGALIGLAIGDSFGDASRKPENQMAYGFTTDFNKGASWSTDDTEFAMLTAQILIESGGRPTSDMVPRLCNMPRPCANAGRDTAVTSTPCAPPTAFWTSATGSCFEASMAISAPSRRASASLSSAMSTAMT